MTKNIHKFKGLPVPDQNWFKMPTCMIQLMDDLTVAELKLVIYLMRHTWGYQEYGIKKKITIDEFMHGRKIKRDGTRMDEGTGLTKPSVINGLRKLKEKGFIQVEVEGTDKARLVKYYTLVVLPGKDVDLRCKKSRPQMSKKFTSYRERNLRKKPHSQREDKLLSSCEGRKRSSATHTKSGLVISDFDLMIAALIKQCLIDHDSDIQHVRESTLATFISEIRSRGINESKIEQVFRWWVDHCDEDYVPQVFKAKDILRFKRFEHAMARPSSNGNGRAKRSEVQEWIDSMGDDDE